MPNKGFWVRVTSRFFLSIATILLVVVGYSIAKSLIRRAEIQKEVNNLQREIQDLENKNEQLVKLIDYLATDEFKEREARLQLGLQKPGENVVVVPELVSQESDNLSAAENSNLSNAQSWFKYFFGN